MTDAQLIELQEAARAYLEATCHFPGVNWDQTPPGAAAARLRALLPPQPSDTVKP